MGTGRRGRPRTPTSVLSAELLAEYRQGAMPLHRLADRVGLDEVTVKRLLRELGIPITKPRMQTAGGKKTERNQAILAGRQSGMSIPFLAQQYQCSRQRIWQILQRGY